MPTLEILISMIAFLALVLSWFVLPSESRTGLAADAVPSAA